LLKKIKSFDEKIYKKLSKYSNIKLIKIIDLLGNILFAFFIIVLFYFLPSDQFRMLSFILLLSLILNTITVYIFKNLFRRRRSNYDNIFVKKIDPHSFPSGHTSRIAGFIIPSFPFPVLFILFIVITIIISITRMIKGYHYLSDCIAGFLIGLTNGFIAFYLFKLIIIRYLSIIFNFSTGL
jgi:undecaprenyl-diphosphatase